MTVNTTSRQHPPQGHTNTAAFQSGRRLSLSPAGFQIAAVSGPRSRRFLRLGSPSGLAPKPTTGPNVRQRWQTRESEGRLTRAIVCNRRVYPAPRSGDGRREKSGQPWLNRFQIGWGLFCFFQRVGGYFYRVTLFPEPHHDLAIRNLVQRLERLLPNLC